MGRLFGRSGLLFEPHNPPFLIDLDHPKLPRCLFCRDFDGRYGYLRAGVHMLLQHAAVIHLVDVVAGQNENELRALAPDRINVLVHRVRRALIPLLRHAHLRRQYLNVIAEPGQRRPARANVPVQAQRLVLRQNENAPQVRIDAIG